MGVSRMVKLKGHMFFIWLIWLIFQTAALLSSCPNDWIESRDDKDLCYFLTDKSITWEFLGEEFSPKLCARLNASMVKIKTEEKMSEVKKILPHSVHRIWLGSRQEAGATEPDLGWRWADGSPVNISLFNDNGPDNAYYGPNHKEDCLQLAPPIDPPKEPLPYNQWNYGRPTGFNDCSCSASASYCDSRVLCQMTKFQECDAM